MPTQFPRTHLLFAGRRSPYVAPGPCSVPMIGGGNGIVYDERQTGKYHLRIERTIKVERKIKRVTCRVMPGGVMSLF